MLEIWILRYSDEYCVSSTISKYIYSVKLQQPLVDGGYCYGLYLDILYYINIQNKQLINILLIAAVRILSKQE